MTDFKNSGAIWIWSDGNRNENQYIEFRRDFFLDKETDEDAELEKERFIC